MTVMRSDHPFREYDRFFQQFFGGDGSPRTRTMPLDARRDGDRFVIEFDLPGVSASDVELTVEDNVLSVRVERRPAASGDGEALIAERPFGTFARQVFLGEQLDTAHIEAEYDAGVLRLVIPVAPHAKPRRIEIADRRTVDVSSSFPTGTPDDRRLANA